MTFPDLSTRRPGRASSRAGRLARGVAVAAATILAAPNARASPDPFSTVTVDAAVLRDVATGDFRDLWRPGAAFHVALATPGPRGVLEASLLPFDNRPAREALPRARMLGTFLGAGGDIALPARLSLRLVARTGVVWMLFDAAGGLPAQDENDLAFGARVSLRRSLGGGWSLEAGGHGVRVLTEPGFDLLFVGGGIARTWDTPGWLRGFLE